MLAQLIVSNTAANPQLAQALSQLKGLHPPEAISPWWPLAPGWWALIIIVPSLITFSLWLWKYLTDKNAIKNQALVLLKLKLKHEQFHLAANETLKRYCQSYYPHAVTLSGKDWTVFLQSTGADFSAEQIELLSNGLYQSQVHYDKQALYSSCKSWLENNKLIANYKPVTEGAEND